MAATFEVLIQIAPAFILGLYLSSKPVFWGMLAGGALAGILTWTGHKTVMGIHGGVLGLLLNILVCVIGTYLVSSNASREQQAEKAIAFEG